MTIDDKIAAEREKLQAFGQEAQEYMDNLLAGLEAQYNQFAGQLGGTDAGSTPTPGFATALTNGSGDFTMESNAPGDGSSLNGALSRIGIGSLKSLIAGKSAASVLQSGAGSLEKLLGRAIGSSLTGGSGGFRLSDSQSALEQAAGLQKGNRNS